jgi:hypothetical protein
MQVAEGGVRAFVSPFIVDLRHGMRWTLRSRIVADPVSERIERSIIATSYSSQRAVGLMLGNLL